MSKELMRYPGKLPAGVVTSWIQEEQLIEVATHNVILLLCGLLSLDLERKGDYYDLFERW